MSRTKHREPRHTSTHPPCTKSQSQLTHLKLTCRSAGPATGEAKVNVKEGVEEEERIKVGRCCEYDSIIRYSIINAP